MLKLQGQAWMEGLRTKWVTYYLLRYLLLSIAVAGVLTVAANRMLLWSNWTFVPIGIVVFALCCLLHPFWKISIADVSRFVNKKYPELEESAGLFLRPENELSLLENIQRSRIAGKIDELQSPKEPLKHLWTGVIFLVVGLVISMGIYIMPSYSSVVMDTESAEIRNPVPVKENVPAQISAYAVQITPPSYTNRSRRSQKQFSIKAELGASVTWTLETNVPTKEMKVVFNDVTEQALKPTNTEATRWKFSKTITQSGYYQLIIAGQKSDLYQIEVIPDLPVNVKITQPKQHTTIDIGHPAKVDLKVKLTDDYGIKDAYISATMASGKGEGVSFTEKKILFNTSFSGTHKNLNKVLDLKALGMKPGDELYYFVKALDNRGQSSRSDVYFVSIVDTAELMSMAGMTNGVNLVPEYFRSQRQIIIDTEKLLKEQVSITEPVFKERSNTLGIDQKLLRLRYGKFLGEESETEIGGDHDHDHDHDHEDDHDHDHKEGEEHDHKTTEKPKPQKQEEKFGDVQAIMDQYAHKHDIAEDATFFEPELKAQLKAVLTEMWSSELRLRTFKPQEALPFEYKALRLLKDLQQKSRAYVAKTTVKVSKLKEEKRLSGELDKIVQPSRKSSYEGRDEDQLVLKRSLSLLEERKTGKAFTEMDRVLLTEVEKQIVVAAADHPASYLPALKSLRALKTSKRPDLAQINLVQKALQKLIPRQLAKPAAQQASPASDLYKSYFNNLRKTAR